MKAKKKLYRSATDRKLAGVCGGIAEYFGISSTVVRVLWIIVTLIYGSGILLYVIAALMIKPKPVGAGDVIIEYTSDHDEKEN